MRHAGEDRPDRLGGTTHMSDPESDATPLPDSGPRSAAMFRKPIPRELASVYRAKPSLAEQGLKRMMDSIGSGLDAVRSAHSLEGKGLTEDSSPPAGSQEQPAVESSSKSTASLTGKGVIGLGVGLLSGIVSGRSSLQ